MPITLSNNVITLLYEPGDLKGSLTSSPWTFADILEKSNEEEWDPPVTAIGNHYVVPYSVYIGANTYFVQAYANNQYNSILFTCDSPTSTFIFYSAKTAKIRLGKNPKSSGTNQKGGVNFHTTVAHTNSRVGLRGDVIVCNSSFSDGRYMYLEGTVDSSAIAYNCSWYYPGLGLYTNAYTEFHDCQIMNGHYGFAINSGMPSTDNLIVAGNAHAIFNNRLSPTIRNIIFKDNTNDIYFNSASNNTMTIVDCVINPAKVEYAGYTNVVGQVDMDVLLQSTFNIETRDEYGNLLETDIKITKNNGDVLFNGTATAGKLTEEVTYARNYAIVIDGELVNDPGTVEDYQPLKMIITKPGYQDFKMEDINVVVGEQTFMQIELEPAVVFVSSITETHCSDNHTDDGSITIEGAGGTEPYEYSIDGGETWSENNVFENLSANIYGVKVKDLGGRESDIYNVEIINPQATTLLMVYPDII